MDKNGFEIDYEKLKVAVKVVYDAAILGRGIFEGGYDVWKKRFLPQWNLPAELEHKPQRVETCNLLGAANYLLDASFFERRNQSRYVRKKLHEIWNNKSTRWFFNPFEVASKMKFEVERIISEILRFNLKNENERAPYESFFINNQVLVGNFGGDPRKLVEGYTAKEARENMRRFHGFGFGIPNLLLMYYADRKIAYPTDPENLLFKIDVHKGRIPINIDALKFTNGRKMIHTSYLVNPFEGAYRQICNELGLEARIADAALWVVGSEVCAKRNYRACLANCPLASNGMCVSNVPLSMEKGTKGQYVVLDEKGNRTETRRGVDSQLNFMGLYAEQFRQ